MLIVALMALVALLVGRVLVAVLAADRRLRERILLKVEATEAFLTEIVHVAVRVDEALPVPEGETSRYEKLLVAQVAAADASSKVPDATKNDTTVFWWLKVEMDVFTARCWDLVERSRRASADGTDPGVLEPYLDDVIAGFVDLADNLERLWDPAADIGVAAELGRRADDRLVTLYERNGWPLDPVEPGSRWPGDPRWVLKGR